MGSVGAPGVGDPFFPLAGNGGIDVQDYGLKLAYDPATDRLDGHGDAAHRRDAGPHPVRP